jgi:hypothetical protein
MVRRLRLSTPSGPPMTTDRLPARDPRTVARDIPGIFDSLFPQLAPGVVAFFNRKSYEADGCEPVPSAVIEASTLQRAMLFEIAVAAGEQLVAGKDPIDWDACLQLAVARQMRHFDAKPPTGLTAADKIVAETVARNLFSMLMQLKAATSEQFLTVSPRIPGLQWISSGVGDFSLGSQLIEVKCTNKHFSASDYRQIVMYWLLGYASSVEGGAAEWSHAILLNPRLNRVLRLPFDEIISVISTTRSKVELLQLFSAMVGDRDLQLAFGIR